MIRRPPRSTQSRSSAASDVYKRQEVIITTVPKFSVSLRYMAGCFRVLSLCLPPVQLIHHFGTMDGNQSSLTTAKLYNRVTTGFFWINIKPGWSKLLPTG